METFKDILAVTFQGQFYGKFLELPSGICVL